MKMFGIFSVVLITLSSLSAWPTTASAWGTDTCDGETMGLRTFRDIEMNRYSIPEGHAREAMFLYAANRWNEVQGVADRFNLIGGSSSSSIEHDDGISDAVVVLSSEIDGAAGLAVMQLEPCVWPYWDSMDGAATEADILIASNLSTGAISPLSTSLGGRETTVHEMGHAIGLNHEGDEMSIMCTSGSCGKFGRWNVLGDLYDYTEQQFPDDIDFMCEYHNAAGSGEDLAASNWWYDPAPDGPRRLYGSSLNRTVCTGASTSVVFAIGNRGEENLTSSNAFDARIVASTNSTISAGDTTLWSGGVYIARGGHGHVSRTVNAPNVPGTYYIGLVLDPNDVRDEQREGDNSVDLGMRLVVQSCP